MKITLWSNNGHTFLFIFASPVSYKFPDKNFANHTVFWSVFNILLTICGNHWYFVYNFIVLLLMLLSYSYSITIGCIIYMEVPVPMNTINKKKYVEQSIKLYIQAHLKSTQEINIPSDWEMQSLLIILW